MIVEQEWAVFISSTALTRVRLLGSVVHKTEKDNGYPRLDYVACDQDFPLRYVVGVNTRAANIVDTDTDAAVYRVELYKGHPDGGDMIALKSYAVLTDGESTDIVP